MELGRLMESMISEFLVGTARRAVRGRRSAASLPEAVLAYVLH